MAVKSIQKGKYVLNPTKRDFLKDIQKDVVNGMIVKVYKISISRVISGNSVLMLEKDGDVLLFNISECGSFIEIMVNDEDNKIINIEWEVMEFDNSPFKESLTMCINPVQIK